jgi:hypothetical protein
VSGDKSLPQPYEAEPPIPSERSEPPEAGAAGPPPGGGPYRVWAEALTPEPPKSAPPDGAVVPSAQRGPQAPIIPPAPPPAPPVHAARKLGFVEGPGREHWWNLLDKALQQRIEQKVGRPIEWWAYRHAIEKERPYAVVFGPKGLAVTTPMMNNAGRPANHLRVWRFDPASVRYAIVGQQPSGGSGKGRPGHRPEATGPSTRLPLTEDMRGFLGNLPIEAQARLQAPFLGDYPVQESDYYYYGTDERVNVWCYLAGARTVMFASGWRVAAADAPPQAASWQVTCRMATVVRG